MEDRKGEWQSRAPYEISYPILFFLFLSLFLFSVPKHPMCCCIRGHSQGREAATDTGWSRTTKILTIVPIPGAQKKSSRRKFFFHRIMYVHMYVLKGNRK